MVLAKINSRPGLREETSEPKPAPRTHRGSSAALLALLVIAGIIAYRGPTMAGRLTIQTEPAGALVRVGNRTLGVTPLQIEGNAGQYWVSIRLDDFEPVDAQVVIPQAGRAVATMSLRPMIGRRKPTRREASESASGIHIADTEMASQPRQMIASRLGGTD